jgi:serine/threonine protein kinase
VYLDYFPEGSLKRKIASGVKFTQDQIFKIAQDSIQGLISMHRHKIVHRDLHAGNILLRSTKDGQYEAALVDFGRSRKYNKIGNGLPQAASSRNPPEGLITSFRKLDRFRVDVYAMACNFYYLLWRKSHSWASAYNSHDMSVYSKSDRKKIYSFIVREYKKTKKEKLSLIAEKIKNGKPLTRMEKFKVITFKMLDFEPSRRPSLAQIAEDLKKLTIKKREQVKSS